ncbi:MAG: hypothetical protein JSS61_06200 [Verrucomicrobia bacterium]|nr:hypothetical protein [Verrucomicrobiota bacterium]
MTFRRLVRLLQVQRLHLLPRLLLPLHPHRRPLPLQALHLHRRRPLRHPVRLLPHLRHRLPGPLLDLSRRVIRQTMCRW